MAARKPRKYHRLPQICLKKKEREQLHDMMSRGREAVRVIKRARILQLLDEGESSEAAARAVGVCGRPGKERRLTQKQASQIVAMVCAPAPEGRARWTVRLTVEEAIERGIVETVGRETLRLLFKEHDLKPWREKNVVHS